MTAYNNPSLSARLLRAIGDRIALRNKKNPRLCIINYHRILAEPDAFLSSEPDVKAFRWQMELLAECFNVMPLHAALAALKENALPPRAVCVTFDDGYRSVHDLALPILKEFNLHATIFVTSGYLGKGNMWNDRIIEAIQTLPTGVLDLRQVGMGSYPLRNMTDRRHAIDKLTALSKYMPPDMRNALVHNLDDMLGGRLSQSLMLTPQLVSNLVDQGMEIGGHTVSHPILSRLDDEAARYEIEAGKRQLEMIIGQSVRMFAYPNGKVGMDFDERHIQMARDAGFTAAFTTALGAATRMHDSFQMPRGRPWDTTPALFGLRLLRWLAA